MRYLIEAAEQLQEALECLNQPLRMSGLVTPESPAGQLTAHRRDGTPVDRYAFLKESKEKLQAATQRARSTKKGRRKALRTADCINPQCFLAGLDHAHVVAQEVQQ